MRSQLLFMSFRFAVYLPETKETIGASMVYSDPFTGGLWIGRAHVEGERTLGQKLAEIKKCEIWMFSRLQLDDKNLHGRRISVDWGEMKWLPFDLDAAKNEPAMEYVCLQYPRYQSIDDVHAVDFPLAVTKAFSPKG